MKWDNPELVQLELGTERPNWRDEILLILAREEAWAEVGGLDNVVRAATEKFGGVARIVDLCSDIEVICEPCELEPVACEGRKR